jgi:hypothetical protein
MPRRELRTPLLDIDVSARTPTFSAKLSVQSGRPAATSGR